MNLNFGHSLVIIVPLNKFYISKILFFHRVFQLIFATTTEEVLKHAYEQK